MNQYEIYIGLLGIIVLVGVTTRKIPAPTPLLLVIIGMLLSYIPYFPTVKLNPDIVMNIFLPLLIYETSAYISWPDMKFNKRPIALLSIGHVIFITVLVAIAAHALIPELSWPLAFVLGSVISPPDDVAIVSIAEKIRMPQRVLTILTGEGLLNDATALIIFRFSLAAVVTHEFSAISAFSNFMTVVVCETLYGFLLGHVIGKFRLKIHEPKLHMMMSILTPFLAYLPAVQLGGSGVLATVVTGLVISHYYLEHFTPEVRLLWHAVWETIGFTLTSILFLLVGLHLRAILEQISSIPMQQLSIYAVVISLIVIVGRFIWVYPSAYVPRYLFSAIRKKDPYPPWQYPFIVSWAGMRGGISLAAAMSVPYLSATIGNADVRFLIIFLVFSVITATLLIQGLTLPWLLKIIGVEHYGKHEIDDEHIGELSARYEMSNAALHWLKEYKQQIKSDPAMLEQVNLQILEYLASTKRLRTIVDHYDPNYHMQHISKRKSLTLILTQIIEVERSVLNQLWREEKITFKTKNKLLEQLDLRAKRLGPSM